MYLATLFRTAVARSWSRFSSAEPSTGPISASGSSSRCAKTDGRRGKGDEKVSVALWKRATSRPNSAYSSSVKGSSGLRPLRAVRPRGPAESPVSQRISACAGRERGAVDIREPVAQRSRIGQTPEGWYHGSEVTCDRGVRAPEFAFRNVGRRCEVAVCRGGTESLPESPPLRGLGTGSLVQPPPTNCRRARTGQETTSCRRTPPVPASLRTYP
ncbi:hypothetical protein EV643_119115 [Kribbella sp. VKM Ac-2527]|uniref:Uncharacterized protein n=1 Tax=Kribbella caucasensis TaxID=2512215 RepID=A0A4R6K446_9ACTN|nr:hypothetical protein EV643_119115 [Kribbella sp. VKM Ac-2527]